MLHLDRAFHLRREHSDPPIACSTFEGYKPRREGVGLPTHNVPASDGSHRFIANDRPNAVHTTFLGATRLADSGMRVPCPQAPLADC